MLRVHAAVFRELDRWLLAGHGFGIDAYGVLVTLVSAPEGTLTIGDLGERRRPTAPVTADALSDPARRKALNESM